MKKLTRSHDRMIAGVLGGIAHYYEIDPTVFRLGYVLFSLFTCFSGILFYIIAWIVIPEDVRETEKHTVEPKDKENKDFQEHKKDTHKTEQTEILAEEKEDQVSE